MHVCSTSSSSLFRSCHSNITIYFIDGCITFSLESGRWAVQVLSTIHDAHLHYISLGPVLLSDIVLVSDDSVVEGVKAEVMAAKREVERIRAEEEKARLLQEKEDEEERLRKEYELEKEEVQRLLLMESLMTDEEREERARVERQIASSGRPRPPSEKTLLLQKYGYMRKATALYLEEVAPPAEHDNLAQRVIQEIENEDNGGKGGCNDEGKGGGKEGGKDGGKDGGNDGGKDGGKDGGRDGEKDGGNDGGKDGGKDETEGEKEKEGEKGREGDAHREYHRDAWIDPTRWLGSDAVNSGMGATTANNGEFDGSDGPQVASDPLLAANGPLKDTKTDPRTDSSNDLNPRWNGGTRTVEGILNPVAIAAGYFPSSSAKKKSKNKDKNKAKVEDKGDSNNGHLLSKSDVGTDVIKKDQKDVEKEASSPTRSRSGATTVAPSELPSPSWSGAASPVRSAVPSGSSSPMPACSPVPGSSPVLGSSPLPGSSPRLVPGSEKKTVVAREGEKGVGESQGSADVAGPGTVKGIKKETAKGRAKDVDKGKDEAKGKDKAKESSPGSLLGSQLGFFEESGRARPHCPPPPITLPPPPDPEAVKYSVPASTDLGPAGFGPSGPGSGVSQGAFSSPFGYNSSSPDKSKGGKAGKPMSTRDAIAHANSKAGGSRGSRGDNLINMLGFLPQIPTHENQSQLASYSSAAPLGGASSETLPALNLTLPSDGEEGLKLFDSCDDDNETKKMEEEKKKEEETKENEENEGKMRRILSRNNELIIKYFNLIPLYDVNLDVSGEVVKKPKIDEKTKVINKSKLRKISDYGLLGGVGGVGGLGGVEALGRKGTITGIPGITGITGRKGTITGAPGLIGLEVGTRSRTNSTVGASSSSMDIDQISAARRKSAVKDLDVRADGMTDTERRRSPFKAPPPSNPAVDEKKRKLEEEARKYYMGKDGRRTLHNAVTRCNGKGVIVCADFR